VTSLDVLLAEERKRGAFREKSRQWFRTHAGNYIAVHAERGIVASSADIGKVVKKVRELGLDDCLFTRVNKL